MTVADLEFSGDKKSYRPINIPSAARCLTQQKAAQSELLPRALGVAWFLIRAQTCPVDCRGKGRSNPMPKRLISYGYAAIIIGLKVFLAALVIAIGVVFIWYGATGDPVVLGLMPPYIIIVGWSVIYYFK
jgi:hypothetical protein